MDLFLFLLLLFFVIIPLGKIVYRAWIMHRRMTDFMRDPIGAAQREAERQARKNDSNNERGGDFFSSIFDMMGMNKSSRSNRRKKIPENEGEYVKFTEIKVTEESSSQSQVNFKTEEQVTDVEWEDIK